MKYHKNVNTHFILRICFYHFSWNLNFPSEWNTLRVYNENVTKKISLILKIFIVCTFQIFSPSSTSNLLAQIALKITNLYWEISDTLRCDHPCIIRILFWWWWIFVQFMSNQIDSNNISFFKAKYRINKELVFIFWICLKDPNHLPNF